VALGALFVRRQRRLADPMIDLRLFRRRLFTAALCVNVIGVFAAFGSFLFITQYLQLVLGMGPLEAGLWLIPAGVIFMAGSFLAPLIVRRFSPRAVLTTGFMVSAAGFSVLTQIDANGEFWVLIVGFVLFCSGLAPMGTLTTDIVMSDVPPERAGVASGMSETSFEFGAALGVAVLGSIVAAVYRAHMSGIELPELSAEAIDNARETLGAAMGLAETLQGEVRALLEASAREAFTRAIHVASFISALLGVVAAIVCARLMRSGP
jgi:MFS transporter, DHA2 family, multidrug resistance protein